MPYSEKDIDAFLAFSNAKKLSTRDRKFLNSLQVSPEELLADMKYDESAGNLKELQQAIDSAKSIPIKKLLLQEQQNIHSRLSSDVPALLPSNSNFVDQILETLQTIWSN